MRPEKIVSGLFLSRAGIDSLKQLFDVYMSSDLIDFERKAKSLRFHFFRKSASFDQFYLGLYAAVLLGENTFGPKVETVVPSNTEGRELAIAQIEFASDIEIPRNAEKSSFEGTLIDELIAVDLYNLRNVFSEDFPATPQLTECELGCVFLTFTLYIDKEKKDMADWVYSFAKNELENSPYWQNIFDRFSVIDHQITSLSR